MKPKYRILKGQKVGGYTICIALPVREYKQLMRDLKKSKSKVGSKK